MGPLAWTVFLCIVSSARSGDAIFDETDSAAPCSASFSGYAFEMLMAKLDYMQHSVLELQSEWAKHREEAAQSQSNSDNNLVEIKRGVQNNFDSMRRLKDDVAQILTRVTTKTNLLSYVPYRSCSDIRNAQSGIYIIQANVESIPFMAYCHRDTKGGGIWLVIQHRFDGSLNFYRNWKEYRNGFGDIEQEFWIGLERLHQLTSGRPHELMVELRDFKGNYKLALYAAFEIGSESEQYNLKTLGEYNGTAGDSLSYHKNRKFSTYDRDNDIDDRNCAASFEGAWWYRYCLTSNLNGLYKNLVDHRSMFWDGFSNSHAHEGLSFSRMMIRPK